MTLSLHMYYIIHKTRYPCSPPVIIVVPELNKSTGHQHVTPQTNPHLLPEREMRPNDLAGVAWFEFPKVCPRHNLSGQGRRCYSGVPRRGRAVSSIREQGKSRNSISLPLSPTTTTLCTLCPQLADACRHIRKSLCYALETHDTLYLVFRSVHREKR